MIPLLSTCFIGSLTFFTERDISRMPLRATNLPDTSTNPGMRHTTILHSWFRVCVRGYSLFKQITGSLGRVSKPTVVSPTVCLYWAALEWVVKSLLMVASLRTCLKLNGGPIYPTLHPHVVFIETMENENR